MSDKCRPTAVKAVKALDVIEGENMWLLVLLDQSHGILRDLTQVPRREYVGVGKSKSLPLMSALNRLIISKNSDIFYHPIQFHPSAPRHILCPLHGSPFR